jgi:putative DNA primase/helicase
MMTGAVVTDSLPLTLLRAAPAPFLFDSARRELEQDSAIDPAVIAERGYESIHRPTNGDQRQRERLRRLGIPTWAIKEDYYFPGLYIPMFGPTGQRVSCQWKPRTPVPNRDGKKMKYASPKGQTSRLDVHPRNTSAITDPTIEKWISEGIKKGDALTSRGICAISLTGVFNWRSHLGTLGDWEDVLIKGVTWTVCFDSDARLNRNVLRAMVRFGRWLKSRGTYRVYYLIVPTEVNGLAVKGVDDFFAAGGTLEELKAARTTTEPNPGSTDDTYSDARLAETIADDVLADQFMWVSGLGWLGWDGRRWAEATDVAAIEAVRQYVLDQFTEAVEALRNGQGDRQAIDGWRQMLGAGRMRSVLALARGIVERKADELDHDLDLLNTPSGVVDLRTGDLLPHDPTLLMTKITNGSYRPGFTHADWIKALEALPAIERKWLQTRIGQAITGHTTPDGVMPVLQGAGENGKSALTTDGPVPALGGYASMASTKLFQASKGSEHSTERADLRGKRLLVAEELTEGRSIDITALKQIQDVGTIRARYVHKDNIEFQASHSLLTTTNYIPVVSETDHGTWRRLALLKFPYTFRKPGQALQSTSDRAGDPTLKARIREGADGQHDAIVTWAVDGAVKWYADPATSLQPTKKINADTREWRTDADRILGLWDEQIIADADRCILATDMLEAFNKWLDSNGHAAWAKETFGPRFEQHAETVKHRVTKEQARDLTGLDRTRNPFGKDAPARAVVYKGVRFQTDLDKGKHDNGHGSGNGGNTSSETISHTRTAGSFPKGLATVATSPVTGLSEAPVTTDGAVQLSLFEGPPELFPGSGQCKHCGEPYEQSGLLKRCRADHKEGRPA